MANPSDGKPIPGEHDRTTIPPDEPAIVGTTGFGADLPATDDSTVDEETTRRNRWEGGGKAVPRPGPDTRILASASPSRKGDAESNKGVTTSESHVMMRRMPDVQVETVWRTASEQCELVWSQFSGVTLRLWVRNRLILEEALGDMDTAFRRAWELRIEWPQFVD